MHIPHIYGGICIYPSFHWWSLCCFHLSAIVNNGAVNMGVQISLWDPAFNYSAYICTSEIAGSYSSSVLCLFAQSCLTLRDPMDCSLPGSSIHGDSPGKNVGVGCHALLEGMFPTQGSNLGLLHCRQNLYCLSNQGSPFYNIICTQNIQNYVLECEHS